MTKIYCKNCGYVSRFTMLEKVSRRLIFDEFGNPDGCTEEISIYTSNVKRCPMCNRKVTIVEISESEVSE